MPDSFAAVSKRIPTGNMSGEDEAGEDDVPYSPSSPPPSQWRSSSSPPLPASLSPSPPSSPSSSPAPAQNRWRCSQVLFDEDEDDEYILDIDIISTIEYDKSGNHLAVGDGGGRITILERTNTFVDTGRKDLERADFITTGHSFRYKKDFESHNYEYDRFGNDIEGKIRKIRWCHKANNTLSLLSTNQSKIKFWKIRDNKVRRYVVKNKKRSLPSGTGNLSSSSKGTPKACRLESGCFDSEVPTTHEGPSSLRLALVAREETIIVPKCQRIYTVSNDFQINSISNNSDGETFISADAFHINLWNFEFNKQPFNIVKTTPTNEDRPEMITSAEFHPIHCNMLAYSSSKGAIRLVDLRQSALCDHNSQLFVDHDTLRSGSCDLDRIIANITDIKFGNGRHILSRDYMTLKLWDINMNSGPVAIFQVHDYLRPELQYMYTIRATFDKFGCCLSGDGLRAATGSYSNIFRVFSCAAGSNEATTLEASEYPTRIQKQTRLRLAKSPRYLARSSPGSIISRTRMDPSDIRKKLLHIAWHPTENSLACATRTKLYIYHADSLD